MQSQNRKRAPAWTEREELDLIAVWGDESVLSELHSKRRNANIFAKISKGLMDRGYNRDLQRCHMKIKELRQAYQKTREANGSSGSEPQTCCFYDELHAILGSAPTTTPPWSVDTCKEGVSCNRHEDFGDEEDDEEEEDSAQQASGEPILPNSQELFITLEPIPSQGGVLDHEAGESTSGTVPAAPIGRSSQPNGAAELGQGTGVWEGACVTPMDLERYVVESVDHITGDVSAGFASVVLAESGAS
ncbi:hypothetical protein UY3_03932 [Chelonia mydas]|uniref:Myb/SANT-like DNA-binding domain-containing protein n=1 Tax=Chelonia mydas TaxID=8469 RepID=M7CDN0_CHEMY|nr:hypothetical protein UY3_03932 [Chelonia mydas]